MSLQEAINASLRRYFEVLGEEEGRNLYRLVMGECEACLLRHVLEHYDYKQVRAARALGITRNTLHRKLREHGLLER